mgnify:CR=1 FL=1
MKYIIFSVLLSMCTFLSVQGFAAEPLPWQLGLQDPATPVKEKLFDFHNLLLVIITGIVLFVLGLLIYVIFRYNEKTNPEPAKFSHNTMIEFIWTVILICILIVIAIPSFKVLFYMDKVVDPDMTLKVTGYQWGWTYTYPDHGNFEFNSDLIEDPADMAEYFPDGNGRRLLETYNPVVLPVNQNIQILVTSRPNDVLHSWAMPSFGIKKDAVPGRLNETWANITKPGIYYGQCSEICGDRHAYMPISIYAVQQSEFEQWAECVKNEETDNFYVARGCVQKFNLDKYRTPLKRLHTLEFARMEEKQ